MALERLSVCRISAEIHDSLLDELLWAAESLGLRSIFVRNARTVQLHAPGHLSHLLGRPETLRENSCVTVFTHVLPDYRDPVLQFLIRACGLDMPGRGSLSACAADILAPPALADAIRGMKAPRAMLNPVPLLGSLMNINCIVQRGVGNTIARTALSLGTSIPVITFGEGTGLRDKLGLLRVTIPAAKEIVNLTVADHDAQGIMQIIIEDAKLNQAGKGFISCTRIDRALLNTKLRVGLQSHAASMEQIITAIDHMAGNSLWRRRFDQGGDAGRLPVFRDRVGVNCIDDEGSAATYSVAAMNAGAGGATAGSLKYQYRGPEAGPQPLSGDSAKDETNFVLQEGQLDRVLDALREAGMDRPEGSGLIEIQPRPLAFTYQQKR
jgi:nitrogen regulatory protein PII